MIKMNKMQRILMMHIHEGKLPLEYSRAFREKTFKLFGELIEDYNQLINSFRIQEKLFDYFNKIQLDKQIGIERLKKFKADAFLELSEIKRNN